MKRKFLIVLLAVVAALCLCFGLAACGEKTPQEPSGATQPGTGGTSQEYTITYDANGGAFEGGETFTQTVKGNSTLTAPASPTWPYHTFAGWAKSRDGSELWDFSNDKVTGDTTLYAVWSQKSATIMSVEGASIDGANIFMLVSPQTTKAQLANKVVCSDDSYWQLFYDELGQREIPSKVAAEPDGELADGENVFYIVVTSEDRTQVNTYVLTVYRQYTVNVTYMTNGTAYDTREIVTGTALTQDYDIACAVKGYTFNGWTHTEEYGDTVWGPVTFTADLTAKTYKVTFDSVGGSDVAEKTVTFDQSDSFSLPSRTGYSFLGWWAGSTQLTNADGALLSAWNIDSDTEVTAHWQANQYQLTVETDNAFEGSVTGGGEFDYDSNVTVSATPQNGYSFLGWYDAKGELLSEDANYTFKMGLAATVTAKWDYYTVTTTKNKPSAGTLSKDYSDEKVSVGTEVTLTADTTTKGYTWVGWYKGDEQVSKEPSYQFTMGRENVTYEARWEAVVYTLTFIYNRDVGDAENIPTSYTVEDLPFSLPKLTGKNDNKHTSVGWTTENGIKYTDVLPQGTTGELTLTVIWDVTEGTHPWQGDTCSVCGIKKPYTKDADKNTITFGKYPQTEVKDGDLKASLGWEAGALPTSDSAGKWTDYGYYIEGSVQSYMWYIDVEYQGSRYRGVYFTSYRPKNPSDSSTTDNSNQDDNGYNTDTVYWFKYEPIEWRILEEKDGKAFLMADIILDAQQYYHTGLGGTREIDGKQVYENNYKESDIRKWLIETFYETAFDGLAKQIIETTTVDNSTASTSSGDTFACEDTKDKVFLLSYQEAKSYGLNRTALQLKSTDYAKSQGAFMDSVSGIGYWWLRSPFYHYSEQASSISLGGNASFGDHVYETDGGVVPALRIRL